MQPLLLQPPSSVPPAALVMLWHQPAVHAHHRHHVANPTHPTPDTWMTNDPRPCPCLPTSQHSHPDSRVSPAAIMEILLAKYNKCAVISRCRSMPAHTRANPNAELDLLTWGWMHVTGLLWTISPPISVMTALAVFLLQSAENQEAKATKLPIPQRQRYSWSGRIY